MPAPAQAVEVTAYYDARTEAVKFYAVATRNVDGTRTWYCNASSEEEAKQRAEQVKIMLDMGEAASVSVHDRADRIGSEYDYDYLLDSLHQRGPARETLDEGFHRNADALDRILAFGDLIDADSLKTQDERDALELAKVNGDVVLANPSNSQTLYRLTESGRRFLSKFSPVGR